MIQHFSSSGKVDINAEVPDTITEWVATAFALNKDSGLGAVEQPSNVRGTFSDLTLPIATKV